MTVDLNSKISQHVGGLSLANIELAHRLDAAIANAAEWKAKHDALLLAQSQAKHDAAVDARDMPSGVPAPVSDLPLP